MTSSKVAAKRAAQAAARSRIAKRRRLLRRLPPVLAFISVGALLAVVAIVASRDSDVPRAGEGPLATASVKISGDELPTGGAGAGDRAIGMQLPEASGITFGGETITIAPTGKPMAIVLLAHWCPHCQNDVREVGAMLREEGLPDGVDVYSVSTFADATRPNYPPSAWLARERWPVPVLVDDKASSVGDAYGLSGTPLWVFTDGTGKVLLRIEGEVGPERLKKIFATLAAGGSLQA